jgi:hypothetical protein
MPAMEYEKFIRDAFSLAFGKPVSRYGDPAGLADTDVFDPSSIASVKAATVYAMALFHKIVSSLGVSITVSYDAQVIDARDLAEISQIIRQFRTEVVDKYFVVSSGVFSPKP